MNKMKTNITLIFLPYASIMIPLTTQPIGFTKYGMLAVKKKVSYYKKNSKRPNASFL